MVAAGVLLLAIKLIDRVGKGIRGAPRDALVADIASPEMRSAGFSTMALIAIVLRAAQRTAA